MVRKKISTGNPKWHKIWVKFESGLFLVIYGFLFLSIKSFLVIFRVKLVGFECFIFAAELNFYINFTEFIDLCCVGKFIQVLHTRILVSIIKLLNLGSFIFVQLFLHFLKNLVDIFKCSILYCHI